ncbi:hypothetical protein ACEPAI_2419 [Sanghuangporus weigelae]
MRSLATSAGIPRSSASRMFICDNPDSVSRARDFLKEAPYVLFDCEGHNIKMPDGSESVSLVQLGAPHADDVFVFDMLALQKSRRATKNILSLICNPTILKVGWGGVEDFSTLARIYKTSITPFLDLQLVDIHSRIRRGESRQVQISRLATLVEHGLLNVSKKENHRGSWSERPLVNSDIRYSANDIVRISELHDYFKHCRILSAKLLADVIAQTALYMELYGPTGILNFRKRFIPSNILPLDIISISISRRSFFTRNRDLGKCTGCHRALSRESFPLSDIHSGTDGKRLPLCKACIFLVKKEKYVLRNAAQTAKRFVESLLKVNY